jgi:hypothetical protein
MLRSNILDPESSSNMKSGSLNQWVDFRSAVPPGGQFSVSIINALRKICDVGQKLTKTANINVKYVVISDVSFLTSMIRFKLRSFSMFIRILVLANRDLRCHKTSASPTEVLEVMCPNYN